MCKKRGLGQEVRHSINSLHLFCRIYKLIGNKKVAQKIVSLWECTPFYKVLYLATTRAKRKEKR